MVEHELINALASSGATALVGAAATDAWQLARAKFSQLAARWGTRRQTQVTERLDETAAQVEAASPAARDRD